MRLLTLLFIASSLALGIFTYTHSGCGTGGTNSGQNGTGTGSGTGPPSSFSPSQCGATVPDDSAGGTTYYVRPDGGSATQCTGLADASYSGSGTGQACAWNHPFIALPPAIYDSEGNLPSPRISGGDRLIIAAGSYQMGYGAPGTEGCEAGGAFDCHLPPIPSGPSSSQPTRIVGLLGSDNSLPELYGVERTNLVLNLAGSDNVRIECLEITDHSACVEFHANPSVRCERDTSPFGDWAPLGLRASDSEDVTLRDLNIHGLAAGGIQAGRIRDWLLDNVRIAGNGSVGWNGDLDGEPSSNAGTITFRRVVIEWNGCGETYPGDAPTQCWAQEAGGYGDGLGTAATGGDWVITDSSFLHNTSDGLDLLYHNGNGTITLNRVRAEGNAGNQLKTNGETTIQNAVAVSNCAFFANKSFTYSMSEGDHCRAGGAALAVTWLAGKPITIVNTTVYSEGDCLIESTNETSCSGAPTVTSRNNIYLGGVDWRTPEERSCLVYTGCAGTDFAGASFDDAYSVIYGVLNNQAVPDPCSSVLNNLCQDPLLDPSAASNDGATLADMIPASGSPAIDSGMTGGSIPSDDLNGTARPQGSGVDRGAYEQ